MWGFDADDLGGVDDGVGERFDDHLRVGRARGRARGEQTGALHDRVGAPPRGLAALQLGQRCVDQRTCCRQRRLVDVMSKHVWEPLLGRPAVHGRLQLPGSVQITGRLDRVVFSIAGLQRCGLVLLADLGVSQRASQPDLEVGDPFAGAGFDLGPAL